MSPEFKKRYPGNAPGRFYIDENCLDCDACRNTAPDLFARDDDGCHAYVKRQPETEEEVNLALEAVESCCVEAIGSDGDEHDWSIPTEASPAREETTRNVRAKCCCHNSDAATRGSVTDRRMVGKLLIAMVVLLGLALLVWSTNSP